MTDIKLEPRQAAIVFGVDGEVVSAFVPEVEDDEFLSPSSVKVAALVMAAHSEEGRRMLQSIYDWFEQKAGREKPS